MKDVKDLIERMKTEQSSVEFYKLKDEIVKALGPTYLAKKIKDMKSLPDFYALKQDMIDELQGQKKKKESE